MAKNIRAKMPQGDTMTVFDVNKEALERFAKEAQPTGVKIAQSPKEVVDTSVSHEMIFLEIYHDESIILSMI